MMRCSPTGCVAMAMFELFLPQVVVLALDKCSHPIGSVVLFNVSARSSN